MTNSRPPGFKDFTVEQRRAMTGETRRSLLRTSKSSALDNRCSATLSGSGPHRPPEEMRRWCTRSPLAPLEPQRVWCIPCATSPGVSATSGLRPAVPSGGADTGWAYDLYTAIIAPLAAGVPTILLQGGFSPATT